MYMSNTGNFLRDCLSDYHDKLLEDAKKENKGITWNNADFLDFVWDRNPRYSFTADDIAVIDIYSKNDVKRIEKERDLWRAERAKAGKDPYGMTVDELGEV